MENLSIKEAQPSVVEVETAIPAFIGYTEKDETAAWPTLVHSLAEYEKLFGKIILRDIQLTVTDETTDPVTIELLPDADVLLRSFLYYSIKLFFANGGSKCYVASAGQDTDDFSKEHFLSALNKLESCSDCTLIVLPDVLKLPEADTYEVLNAALDQCSRLKDRFLIIDVRMQTDNTSSIDFFRHGITTDLLKRQYGAAYYPFLETNLGDSFLEEQVWVPIAEQALAGLKENDETRYRQIRKALEAFAIVVPPGGAIAGIYSVSDNTRGVWKAPANLPVKGVTKPVLPITNQVQDQLNIDVADGKSINAIRSFTGKDTLVWGSRTLAGNDAEWRYVSVRRFFIMAEQSLRKAVAAFVFEPNDANTWARVRAMMENYLMQLWRAGALVGTKPEQAFYVRIGFSQTMTARDIEDGNMIVELGMAVVRPAEFIMLRFAQKMQAS